MKMKYFYYFSFILFFSLIFGSSTLAQLRGMEFTEENMNEALINIALDINSSARVEAILMLGEMGQRAQKAVGSLIQLLDDRSRYPYSTIRERAIDALGEIGSKLAIPHLEKLLHDENENIRKISLEAIENIQGKS